MELWKLKLFILYIYFSNLKNKMEGDEDLRPGSLNDDNIFSNKPS